MLILSRKRRESIMVGDNNSPNHLLKVTVLDVKGSTVKLGFEAPAEVVIHRSEVWRRICGNESPGNEPLVREEAEVA